MSRFVFLLALLLPLSANAAFLAISNESAVNALSGAVPACPTIAVTPTGLSSGVVSLYSTDTDDDTVGEVEASIRLGQFSSSDNNVTYTFTPTKAELRSVVDTAETAYTNQAGLRIECQDYTNTGTQAVTFFAANFASNSNTGGIQEALDACEAVGGGIVQLPRGVTTIDMEQVSPGVTVGRVDNGSGSWQVPCALKGYGPGGIEPGVNEVTGSTIRCNNMDSAGVDVDGRETCIRVEGGEFELRDFRLTLSEPTTASRGIWIASEEATDGSTIIDSGFISNLTMRDPNAGDVYVGIEITALEDFTIESVFIDQAGVGILYDDPPGPATNRSNSGHLRDISVSGGAIGIDFEAASAADAFLYGFVCDGATTACVRAQADSIVNLMIYAAHMEADAGARNILVSSDEANIVQFGGRLIGAGGPTDFERTAAQVSNVGDDLFYGVEFGNNSTSNGRTKFIDPIGTINTLTGIQVISSDQDVEIITGTTHTVPVEEMWTGKWFICFAAGCDFTLPQVAEGMKVCFLNLVGLGTMVLDSPNIIAIPGLLLATGNATDDSGGIGNSACLVGISSTHYTMTQPQGTWTDGGVD